MDPTPPADGNPPRVGRGRFVAAFLLSLVGPGAGHFLLGGYRRGAAWAVGLPVVALGVLLAARGPLLVPGVLLAFAIAVFGRFAVAIDSIRLPLTRPPWRAVLIGWTALLAFDLVVLTPVRSYIRDHHLQTFRIPSGSMRPTLLVGDYFLADNRVYRSRPPARGELVVLVPPTDDRQKMVKRVVALPGESVGMRGGRVIVAGRPLSEPYLGRDRLAGVSPTDCDPALGCEPVTVPPDSYFVLGDDRENSMDSRHWGSIPRERIVGRVEFIYWSWDPSGGPRFERIGRRP